MDGDGGAVFAQEGSTTTFTRRSSMMRNWAAGSGGGAYNAGVVSFETSAEFRANEAAAGAATAAAAVAAATTPEAAAAALAAARVSLRILFVAIVWTRGAAVSLASARHSSSRLLGFVFLFWFSRGCANGKNGMEWKNG